MTTVTAKRKIVARRVVGKVGVVEQKAVRNLLASFYYAKVGAVVPDFEFRDGMLYTSVRAISARINQNWDGWPSNQLAESYRTFLGKPVFVNHANFDPKRARGRVVAARYIENGKDKYIQVIQEVDAIRFPKLAHEIRTGGLDSVSMGVEAGFTICSYCGNKATDVFDMCDHVKFHKGTHLPDVRTGEPVLVYENCYKLGFFELSYVFDPADETAVVSQVIVANRRKKAWGEIEAPEDIDTLRDDDDDSPDDYEFVTPYREPDEDMPFQNSIESPEELQTPNFDQTKRLDRDQEAEGLDNDRLVENVEEVGAPGAPGQQQQAQPIAARKTRRKAMGRTRTKRAAEDEDSRPPWLNDGGGDEGGEEAPPPPAPAEDDGGDEESSFDPEGDEGFDEGYDDGGGEELGAETGGVEDLVQSLQDTVDALSDQLGIPDDSDDLGEEEFGGEAPPPPMPTAPAGPPPQFASRRRQPVRRRAADCDEKDDEDSDDDDKPPWLKEKESRRRSAQRPVNGRSPQKKGRKGTQKGAQAVGAPRLAERSKVAAAARGGRANNRRVADDSGHTDGGPYGENNLGEQAETFIPSVYGEGDGVPPEEGVVAPTGDGSKAPNSETNLVARIQAKSQSLQRDINLYNQMQRQGTRRQAEGVEQPSVTNPELSGTDDQSLRGDDFQDVGLSSEETQPKDASRHWFAQFNNWLTQVTGQPWNYHNSGTLTRAAARWSKGSGVPLDALFPTLQTALRQAGKGEARSSSMRRRAEDEKLEVAAPDDRVDVEKPVSGETDADAQASQFDLGDFGGNAGDNLADPEMSVDSQIWAPGEGEAAARSAALHKKAEGMLAVRCAEAYIRANLVSPEAKWKIASWLQTQPEIIVADRVNMLDAVCAANARAFAAARTPAGRTRGAATGEIPPGFGSGRRVASTQRESALDPKFDSMMWI